MEIALNCPHCGSLLNPNQQVTPSPCCGKPIVWDSEPPEEGKSVGSLVRGTIGVIEEPEQLMRPERFAAFADIDIRTLYNKISNGTFNEAHGLVRVGSRGDPRIDYQFFLRSQRIRKKA